MAMDAKALADCKRNEAIEMDQVVDSMQISMQKCIGSAGDGASFMQLWNSIREPLKSRCGPYDKLLEKMDRSEDQQGQFVDELNRANFCVVDYNKQLAAMFQEFLHLYKGKDGAIAVDTWNVQHFNVQLRHLDSLGEACEKCAERLHEMKKAAGSDGLGQAVRDVERLIHADDRMSVIRDALQKSSEVDQEQRSQRMQLRDAEVKYECSVVQRDALIQLVQDKDRHTKRLESELATLDMQIYQLDQRLSFDKSSSIAHIKEVMGELDRSLKACQEEQAASLQKRNSSFQQSLAHLEQKTQQVSDEVRDAASFASTHVIFCLDISWSMAGARWKAVLNAVSSFETVRRQQGCIDRTSVVLFNGSAESVITYQELSSVADSLKAKVWPSGGTKYVPAWREISSCAARGQHGEHVFVLFVTDGESNDIGAASELARPLFQSRQGQGGMTTAIIDIKADDKSRAGLKQLLTAANGGRETALVGGLQRDLFLSVRVWDLTSKFSDLAAMASMRQQDAKARLSLAREQERQARIEHKEAIESLDAHYEAARKRLLNQKQLLTKTCEGDEEAVAAIVAKHRKDLLERRGSVEGALETARAELLKLQEKARTAEVDKCNLEKTLSQEKQHFETVEKDLSRARELSLKTISESNDKSVKLLADHRTADADVIKAQSDNLRQLVRLHGCHLQTVTGAALWLQSIRSFQRVFSSRIQDPISDFGGSTSDDATFVVQQLLEDIGEEHVNPASTEAVLLILEREALSMLRGLDRETASDIARSIVYCDIQAADLVKGCRESGDAERLEVLDELVQKIEAEALEAKGISLAESSTPTLKKREKAAKEALAEAARTERQLLSKLRRAVEEEETDRLQAALDEAQGSKASLEAELETVKELMLNVKNILESEDCRRKKKVVTSVFNKCHKAYNRRAKQAQIQTVERIYKEAYHNVARSIFDFVSFSKAQKDLVNGTAAAAGA